MDRWLLGEFGLVVRGYVQVVVGGLVQEKEKGVVRKKESEMCGIEGWVFVEAHEAG